jgi:hypothetical protein
LISSSRRLATSSESRWADRPARPTWKSHIEVRWTTDR